MELWLAEQLEIARRTEEQIVDDPWSTGAEGKSDADTHELHGG